MNELSIKKFPSRKGVDTIEVDGYLLHSKYDPKKEVKNIIENEFKENYFHVIFGYGLGYMVEELKQQKYENDFMVIDPYKEELGIDSDEVLSFDIDSIKNILFRKLEFRNSGVKVVCSPNYNKIAEKQYLELLKAVKETQIVERLNSNTVKTFALEWQENYIKNMIFACEDIQFNEITNKYTIPVVVASGGPSLTKQLSYLKEYRNKIIIIAAGSTINSLLKAGIEPDFVVTVDGGYANYRHFEHINSINSILIYSLSSHYEIQNKFAGKRIPFLLNDDQYINEILKDCEIELPYLNGGTSVANYAFEIAKKITIGPIALVGQDLAYTNNQSHAENNTYSMEIDEAFIKSRGLFETEGYFNDTVLTDYKFLVMKTRFEELVKLSIHPSAIYNCTEGGVKINGFEQLSFEGFLKQYTREQDRVVEKDFSCSEFGKKEILYKRFKSYRQKKLELQKNLKGTLILLKRENNARHFSDSLIAKLNKTDQQINEFFKKNSFSHILQPIISDTLSNYKSKSFETEQEKFNRVYNQTENLYINLISALEKISVYLDEAIILGKGE